MGIQFQVNGPNKHGKRTHGFVETRTKSTTQPNHLPLCTPTLIRKKHLLPRPNKTATTRSLKNGISVYCNRTQHELHMLRQTELLKWTEGTKTTNPLETGCWFALSAVEHQHHRMTRHIMEMWERYDLLFMLCTSITNNSTPHRQHGLMGDKRTSSCSLIRAGVRRLACARERDGSEMASQWRRPRRRSTAVTSPPSRRY